VDRSPVDRSLTPSTTVDPTPTSGGKMHLKTDACRIRKNDVGQLMFPHSARVGQRM